MVKSHDRREGRTDAAVTCGASGSRGRRHGGAASSSGKRRAAGEESSRSEAGSVALFAGLLQAVELLLHELLRAAAKLPLSSTDHVEEGVGRDGAVTRILVHGADEVARAERAVARQLGHG